MQELEAGVVSWSTPSMGGTLGIALVTSEEADDQRAIEAARRAGLRVNAWAQRLTRFTDRSDLAALNNDHSSEVAVRPTLASVLSWAEVAERQSQGIVRPTLLDQRLAAEHGIEAARTEPSPWRLTARNRAAAVVQRPPGLRFDLDGLAKGWLADRAADLLWEWPGAAVDADGDICLHVDAGVEWLIDVADPRSAQPNTDTAAPLATLRIRGKHPWRQTFGVATSGTSVHCWSDAHHLIDPRTGKPAQTDVVQATVVAPTAREAEVIAKSAVILGSDAALGFLDKSAALAAMLLLESGDVACLEGIESWLA
jgi:thiamine biosynthesis lipoprotein